MRLSIVTGYREYLLPNLVPSDRLLEALRTRNPEVTLPVIGWASVYGETRYHTYLYERETEVDARVDLFLEYLEDMSHTGHLSVLLPFESFIELGSRNTAIADHRVRHFVESAQNRFGAEAVRCQRLSLSDNTQAVLELLLATDPDREGASACLASSVGADPLRIDELSITPMVSGGTGSLDPEIEGMRRNYSRAVLRLCHRIVSRASIFGGSERAESVADLLDENRLHVRPELPPERILAELEPGGELFELLSRPFATLHERRPREESSLGRIGSAQRTYSTLR